MSIIDRFSRKFKEIRIKKKLTQEDISFKSGLSVYYVSKVERGQANPSLKTIEKIAQALNVSIKDLF